MTPVVKSTYNDADYLRIQTSGLSIKNPITTSINKNMFVIRYYTWPDSMTKPSTIQRGSDDWCFMRQDSTYIWSSSLSKTRFTSTHYSQHTLIEVPEEKYVN